MKNLRKKSNSNSNQTRIKKHKVENQTKHKVNKTMMSAERLQQSATNIAAERLLEEQYWLAEERKAELKERQSLWEDELKAAIYEGDI